MFRIWAFLPISIVRQKVNQSWLVHKWSIMNEGINIVEAQFCDGDIVPRDSLEVYIVLEFSY